MKPKLLAADIQMVEHNGRQGFLLKERIGLADHVVIVPQALGTLLALLDGQRDVGAIRAAFTLRTGMVLPPSLLDELLSELDAAYLLDSPRFRAALAQLRDEYRAAPSRPMALAGGCYPAGVDELQKAMDDYCRPYRDAPVLPKDLAAERIRGLVTPHIDYARGHDTYAQVWLGAEQAVRGAELAIILGTDHMGTEPILTPTVQSYATPWGILPTDRQIAEEVAEAEGAEAAFADEIHHLQEHSIELAAVWLHYVRRGEPLSMVPLLCGSFESLLEEGHTPLDDARIMPALEVLRRAAAGRRTLVIAAGDLSHVGPAFGDPLPFGLAEKAHLGTTDAEVMERIVAGDAEEFFARFAVQGDGTRVCGLPPIYWALQIIGDCRGHCTAYAQCPADEAGGSLVSIAGIWLE